MHTCVIVVQRGHTVPDIDFIRSVLNLTIKSIDTRQMKSELDKDCPILRHDWCLREGLHWVQLIVLFDFGVFKDTSREGQESGVRLQLERNVIHTARASVSHVNTQEDISHSHLRGSKREHERKRHGDQNIRSYYHT